MAALGSDSTFGVILLTAALLGLFMRWVLPYTRFGHALQKVESDMASANPVFSRLKISELLLVFGAALVVAGSALILAALVADGWL